jgi:hypothetical protein
LREPYLESFRVAPQRIAKSLDPGTGFNDRLAGYVPLVVTKMVLDR